MAAIWLTTSIWQNRLKLIYLILLLPVVVILCIFLYLIIIHNEINNLFWDNFLTINTYLVPVLILWLIVWIYLQKQIIFKFTWAKEVTRKEEPEIYNIVENLCISRGLITPKIWIIEDNSLNAFATWWSPKSSWVVFSRWLINKLDKKEIEAVAAHELTHIINWDVKNMVIINVFIWAVGTIWYLLMRTGMSRWSSRSKGKNPLPLLWLFLYLASILLLPLINLAISRKKEYLADAWAVQLTKDNESMINALKKISNNSIIESVADNGRNVASMFIGNPRNKPKLFWELRSIFSTHPSIESRIEALQRY